MNRKALAILEKVTARQAQEVNVGDLVIASPDGASFVNAYVYEIHNDYIVFQSMRGNVLFDCERVLAEQVTVLIEKFENTPKAQLVAEILAMVGAA